MAKKKKKKSVPKWKTLQRPRRLLSAKDWLGSYSGKNIVRGYAKHFGTDLLCAIKELRTLGVTVSVVYEESVKRAIADRKQQNRKKKEARMANNGSEAEHDETFAFIGGYTSGGAPYGITWEEMSADNLDKYTTQNFE